jgi:hypothetical protein
MSRALVLLYLLERARSLHNLLQIVAADKFPCEFCSQHKADGASYFGLYC